MVCTSQLINGPRVVSWEQGALYLDWLDKCYAASGIRTPQEVSPNRGNMGFSRGDWPVVHKAEAPIDA